MLECRSADIDHVNSVRLMSGKAAGYDLFWVGKEKGLEEQEFSCQRNVKIKLLM